MISSLDNARARHSPRYHRSSTPAASVAVHGAVGLVWVLLFAVAFGSGGAAAWSTGVAYIVYDTLLLVFVGWQTLVLLRPPRPLGHAPGDADDVVGPPLALAVVVAARDEATVLARTIAALIAQPQPPEAIVIADDGSTDDTARLLVERFGLALPPIGGWASSTTVPSLHWLRLAHGGKARALNAALVSPLAAAQAPIVVTVDADTDLAPGAIAAMRDAFTRDRSLVAATGVLTPVCGRTAGGRLFEWFQTYEYLRNFLSRYAWMRVDSLLLISGAFAGFRRDAIVEVGGFDPDCLVEDYELIHRLARFSALERRGWRTAVVGGAIARTEAPSSVAAFLRQRRRWFGGFLQTQFWYRGMVGDGRFGNVGRWMLPVKAIDTMQPIFGLTALAIVIVAIVQGRVGVLVPASAWIVSKIVVDLAFHAWSVHLYRRWIGGSVVARPHLALVAALLEPFSFQLLRHLGATLGWVTFLSRQRHWGKQERLVVSTAADDAAPR